VEVEVFFGRFVLSTCVAEVCEGRIRRHHQQGQRLRARRRKLRLFTLLNMVRSNASDRVEETGVGVRHSGQRSGGEVVSDELWGMSRKQNTNRRCIYSTDRGWRGDLKEG
jgi:hypothetical protein